MSRLIAGAPVSFGVFEMTPEGADVVTPDDMLAAFADIGYDGVDLGPVGYFGDAPGTRARLERFGLDLAGGWIQLPLSDDEAFAASLPGLDAALHLFRGAVRDGARKAPLPTLADNGSPARRAAPGRGAEVDPLDDAGWRRLAANASRAAESVRRAGFEPTFHHHAGTYVESAAEIERFLSATDIGLTLDIGHLVLAGGDPLAAARDWAGRINHLHVKDVDAARLAEVVSAGGGMPEVWASGAFTALGRGDLDIPSVLDAVVASGFDGWIVVEQDVLNGPDVPIAEFLRSRTADQRTNREALRSWV